MQALPDCSIAEEAQDEDEEVAEQEEGQGLPPPAKGLFGRTQALKAQPQQSAVMPFLSLTLLCLADRLCLSKAEQSHDGQPEQASASLFSHTHATRA